MIFRRAQLREFGNYAAAVFLILFAIVVTSQLVRLLGRAAGGSIPGDAIVALIGFTAINYLPILLALTLFVSVLMTVSRAYRDSEMVIWSTAGLSLLAWVRPVLMFAGPLVLVIALMALFLSPWANERAEAYQKQLENRDEISRLAPGVFRESANAQRVFFVESADLEQGRVKNVFVASRQHGRTGVVISPEGYIEVDDSGDRYAVLMNGRRYEGVPGTPEYRITEFKRYVVRIHGGEPQRARQSAKTMGTQALLDSEKPAAKAELLWRIGLPFVALNLALLAVPLGFVNPRASRSMNLLFAVFAYMLYTNLLGVVQAWVGQGKLAFGIGWWVLHALALAIIALLFYGRIHLGFTLRRR